MSDGATTQRPAVIEVSVVRGRTNRLHPVEWLMVLRLAKDHGWVPEGAIAFAATGEMLDRDPWYGLAPDGAIAYRSIDGGDLRRLANALARGARGVAKASEDALLEAAGAAEGEREREADPTALEYFVEQGLAADWLEQLADDLTDTATLLVHGDIDREWAGLIQSFRLSDDVAG